MQSMQSNYAQQLLAAMEADDGLEAAFVKTCQCSPCPSYKK